MNSFVLLYGAFVALSKLQSLNVTVDPVAWESFKVEHGKQYQNSQEELLRSTVFHLNKHHVDTFNAEHSDRLGYKLGLNNMSDWTEQEKQILNGYKPSQGSLKASNDRNGDEFLQRILEDDSIEVPDEIDWRKTPGIVTGVKNQALCGSCWAFASTGALEGQELARNKSIKSLIRLSEQNLVDCVKAAQGCEGGMMQDAFAYVHQAGGIEDETSYYYEALNMKCRFNQSLSVFSDNGYAILKEGDEEQLKQVVAKFGPVSVAINVVDDFQGYRSGVYDSKTCSSDPKQMNHGVLVVGYGTTKGGSDYWIVKNSWGPGWGDSGYILMSRNKQNQCGIANVATIPTF